MAGLVVLLPVSLTLWLMWTFVGWIDSIILPVVPDRLQPGEYVDFHFRGVGVAFFLLVTLAIGWFAKVWAGRSLIRATESAVSRTPLVRSIYGGVKQIAEALVSQTDASFDTVCLVQYPRPGIWTLAFVASAAKGELAEAIKGYDPPVAVFLPTTPNPTTGFLLLVPRSRVMELQMSLEDGVKLIMSGGLVQPQAYDNSQRPNWRSAGVVVAMSMRLIHAAIWISVKRPRSVGMRSRRRHEAVQLRGTAPRISP